MADATAKNKLDLIAEILHRHGAEFIVIGGQAETLHGGARVTYDVDLCYRRTRDNIVKLAAALRELKPTLRGAPPDLPFTPDARTIELGSNFTFDTPIIPLDLLGYVEPLGEYDALRKNAVLYRSHGLDLWTISPRDLLTVKLHINRPKDQESIAQLRAIIKIQEEQPKP